MWNRLYLGDRRCRKPATTSTFARESRDERFIAASERTSGARSEETVVSARHNDYFKQPAGRRIQSAFLGKCTLPPSDDVDYPPSTVSYAGSLSFFAPFLVPRVCSSSRVSLFISAMEKRGKTRKSKIVFPIILIYFYRCNVGKFQLARMERVLL